MLAGRRLEPMLVLSHCRKSGGHPTSPCASGGLDLLSIKLPLSLPSPQPSDPAGLDHSLVYITFSRNHIKLPARASRSPTLMAGMFRGVANTNFPSILERFGTTRIYPNGIQHGPTRRSDAPIRHDTIRFLFVKRNTTRIDTKF